jgi:hypothetical protein
LSREEFEKEDDQYHCMIVRYGWLHEQKKLETLLKAIFGEPKPNEPLNVELNEGDDIQWESGNSLNRFKDPKFLKNVEKLK